MSLLELSAGSLRAALAPHVGGSLASFSRVFGAARTHAGIDWLRPASPQDLDRLNPLGMASFPLVPFCNRIRNGRASFSGREIRFPPNHPAVESPHPLHGIGWLRPWTVEEAGPSEAVLSLRVDASSAWPWHFAARQHFRLHADRLDVTLAVTNGDDVVMPVGIGHHPYFPHTPGTRLTSRTRAVWLADPEVMPTALQETEAVRQLRSGVTLADLDLDNNFVGWERQTLVEWPADAAAPARRLLMRAQAPLDYFVLYCPRGFGHFCAEPVSQCTDWLNLLPDHGREDLGGHELAPGETLQASFSLVPDAGLEGL